MPDSLQPHELQHATFPCPSVSPRVCSNLHQWYYLTVLFSATRFSSCPQSFPASGFFPRSWLFSSGGQSSGAPASTFPMNIQGWFSLGLTGLISLQSKGLSRVFSSTIWKHQFFRAQPSLWPSSHSWSWHLRGKKQQQHSFVYIDRPLWSKWCLCLLICCLGLS